MLAVRNICCWRLDAGTYETECTTFLGQSSRGRVVIKCNDEGNIAEVIKYFPAYDDDSCSSLLLDYSYVFDVSLTSGNISTNFVKRATFR